MFDCNPMFKKEKFSLVANFMKNRGMKMGEITNIKAIENALWATAGQADSAFRRINPFGEGPMA